MKLHKQTKRDYLQRVVEHDKAKCAELALKYDVEYWDGDRSTGYGGMRYDGRWRGVAEEMAEYYRLPEDARILDVGCGKGFLLYEFTQVLPKATVAGLDISRYALDNAKEEVKPFLTEGTAASLPYDDHSFDFVVSLNTLHNLYCYDLHAAIKEIERVGIGAKKHIGIETYRNEQEKVNLMLWQLTCRIFHTPQEWEWEFDHAGYKGDYSYIAFD
jgi:ubiquinone/menaquinone biosynthesis C-methylase UbiE